MNRFKLTEGENMQRRQRKREALRQKIFETAIQLFIEKGYDQTGIRDIAEAVDIGVGTFHNYFASKEDVLKEFSLMLFEDLRDLVSSESFAGLTGREQVERIFDVLVAVCEEEPTISKAVIKIALQKPFETLKDDTNQLSDYQALFEIFLQVVENATNRNELKLTSSEQVKDASDLLTMLYYFTIGLWAEGELRQPLREELSKKCNMLWRGFVTEGLPTHVPSVISGTDSQNKSVVVVGGGLAGLSVAANLASKGFHVTVVERGGKLGGRAVTIDIKGFKLNYGAHAIYGRDRSVLRKYEKEIGLKVDWKDFDPNLARYDLGESMSAMPATLGGLMQTQILESGRTKIQFMFDVLRTIAKLNRGERGVSIGEWLKRSQRPQPIQEMLLTLASSNFFTREPERIPSDIFFAYYKRLFTTQRAVAYIGGGWQAIVEEFVRIIKENNGVIHTKAKLEGVTFKEDRVASVQVAGIGELTADHYVFCAPPSNLVSLFGESPIAKEIETYGTYDQNVVLVYDVALSKRMECEYTYVYDKLNQVFVTDISHYDTTCTPPGGQLLQGIAYMRKSDIGNRESVEHYKAALERIYDKHFTGWRDHLVVHRFTERAVAQEIKVYGDQRLMPVQFVSLKNAYFAGDWCEGEGQLSELSFSSGYEVARRIAAQHES
jgi:15-cis-phytoene desaturase